MNIFLVPTGGKTPYQLPNKTVEGLDSVIITYNGKKPDCIQLTFKGMKMTGLSGIVAWNTLNPVTDLGLSPSLLVPGYLWL